MSNIVGFNYTSIKNATVREQAREHALEIHEMLKMTSHYAVEIGKRLLAMKAALGVSQFHAWREHEIKMPMPTASNLMRAAQRFGDVDCVGKFATRALYLLSRESVPDSVVAHQIARARNGEHVTQRSVELACDAANVRRRRGRTTNVLVRAGNADALARSVEKLGEMLRRVCTSMTRDEREDLADRFLQLALELRAAGRRQTTDDEELAVTAGGAA